MIAANSKTFLLPLSGEREQPGDPEFAYLEVTPETEAMLYEARAALELLDFETITKGYLAKDGCLEPLFVSESGESIKKIAVEGCNLVIGRESFWLEVSMSVDGGNFITHSHIGFDALEEKLTDSEIEKIEASLVEEFSSDDRIAYYTVNALTGELNIPTINDPHIYVGVESIGDFVRFLLLDDEANEYRVFKDETHDRYFVTPSDLIDLTAAQSEKPRQS